MMTWEWVVFSCVAMVVVGYIYATYTDLERARTDLEKEQIKYAANAKSND